MAISGLFFILTRVAQIITLIPIVGMLAWFVNGFTDSNTLTPDFILVLFITSVLALVWALGTLFRYNRSKRAGLFVAFIDLCIVGSLIAGVYLLRGITNADCANFTTGSIYIDLGPFGYYGRDGASKWGVNVNKTCAMLKASFALGIINIILFFFTFLLALLLHRHFGEDKVVVRRETHYSRHGHRRSRSRDYYSNAPRRSSSRHSSRRYRSYV